jgi:hypothetical protein
MLLSFERSGSDQGGASIIGAIEQVLVSLNMAQVRYLVVGGVAVVLHGYLRTTADLDLVIQLTPDNIGRAMTALAGLGYRPRAPVTVAQFSDMEVRRTWQRDKGLTVLSFWSDSHPTLEVDLFVQEPFDFDEAYRRAVEVQLDTTSATVVALDDLVALKLSAGRPLDLVDIEALRALGPPDGGQL